MKKRILIITPEFPYPLNSGGKQAQFHILNKLRSEYEVSLLFQADNVKNEIFQELHEKWIDVTFYPFFNKKTETPQPKSFSLSRLLHKLIRILRKNVFRRQQKNTESILDDNYARKHFTLYYSVLMWYSNDFLKYVYDISRKDFDIIQVEFYDYLPLIHILPEDKERIFAHHEIRFVRNGLELQLLKEKNVQDKFIYDLSKSYELNALSLYDKIIVLSEIDKLKLKKELPHCYIYSSPAMIEPEEVPNSSSYKFNNKLVFIGSCSHYPNEDGAKWFFQNVWYKLIESNNNLEFHLIGKWDDFIEKAGFERKNVFVHTYIQDLRTILPNSIMVVPIRIGSGIRMKIIDAINYRIPFVTTSVGVEGLDFRSGVDCLIADTPEEFISALRGLINNQDLQLQLIEGAVGTMDNLYDEETILNQRIAVYESVLNV